MHARCICGPRRAVLVHLGGGAGAQRPSVAHDQRACEVNALKIGLPWVTAEMRATEELMGADFWPYGVGANRKTLETGARYVFEQAITPHQVAVEDMFAASTLKGMKI